jgi:hypothetical protein
MPDPTREELKKAAKNCAKNGECLNCPDSFASFDADCPANFVRALLSAFEREEKMLEALKALCPDGDIGDGLSSGYTLSSDSILAARAAIKAAEEGR